MRSSSDQDRLSRSPSRARLHRLRLVVYQVKAGRVSRYRHGVPHPPGRLVDVERPRGYHIDLRMKLDEPSWDLPADPADASWIGGVMQPGLAMFEHYLWSGREDWRQAALRMGDYLLAGQRTSGAFTGCWLFNRPRRHTYSLRLPWVSSMAQGQGASLLTRLALETGEARYADAASLALRPLTREVGTPGGCAGRLDDGSLTFEEYPTVPGSHVLNGFLYTLFGAFDIWKGAGDRRAEQLFRAGASSLVSNLHRWDTGYWSLYDLYPHPVPNVASPFYHRLHIDLLDAFESVWPDDRVPEFRRRLLRYQRNPLNRARAIGAKIRFRRHSPRWHGRRAGASEVESPRWTAPL